ncbi:hypothetical protein COU80_03560 [Candidatus Peregrinibacteria bacterium CG10_big_fil_rev_8_21_14_0_10_55_24]|nr:MAG: hypothetical protein COU80_03560 [Candidatus Peregrinibacteria bacterium CG10_big_fil_rev_8_21_14_0_10_55_24]
MLSKKKLLLALTLTIPLGWIALYQDTEILNVCSASAQGTEPESIFTTFHTMVSVVATIFQFLALLLIHLMEILLDPGLITSLSATVNNTTGNPLQEIWQVARDITNVIFAFLFIAGTVIVVVTAKKDIIGQYLIKFILAVILVNFSWFFPRVILDTANILTATVYSMPSALGIACQVKNEQGNIVPCTTWEDVAVFPPAGQATAAQGYVPLANGAIAFKEVPLNANTNTPQGILTGLALNHTNIKNMLLLAKNAAPPPGTTVQKMGVVLQGIIQIVFVLVLLVALLFPLMAMTVAFVIRIPILWLTIAFMPFMFLGFVIGEKMGPQGKFNSMIIFRKFIAAAFLPFAVAIPLTIGYILVNIGTVSVNPGNLPQGSVLESFFEQQNFLVVGINSFVDLLWKIMTLGVFWVGTFTALKIDDAYAGVSETIRGWGKAWGTIAVKAPLALPILPIPGAGGARGKSVSPLGLLGKAGPGRLSYKLDQLGLANADVTGTAFDFSRAGRGAPPGTPPGAPPGAPAGGGRYDAGAAAANIHQNNATYANFKQNVETNIRPTIQAAVAAPAFNAQAVATNLQFNDFMRQIRQSAQSQGYNGRLDYAQVNDTLEQIRQRDATFANPLIGIDHIKMEQIIAEWNSLNP